MEKYITNERTGPKYELVGNYYLIAGDDEPDEEQKPIGIWGKRHHEYQNVKTTPSSVYEWGLDHGGRNGLRRGLERENFHKPSTPVMVMTRQPSCCAPRRKSMRTVEPSKASSARSLHSTAHTPPRARESSQPMSNSSSDEPRR